MSKKAKINKLKELLNKRDDIIDQIKDLNAAKGIMDNSILSLFDHLNITTIDSEETRYRKQKNRSVKWDGLGFKSFLEDKFGIKTANSMVNIVTKKEYIVNEDNVRNFIASGHIQVKKVKKYIEVKDSNPFIRSYNIKEE